MKGFIQVTEKDSDKKFTISVGNILHIEERAGHALIVNGVLQISTKESYSKILAKIDKAQRGAIRSLKHKANCFIELTNRIFKHKHTLSVAAITHIEVCAGNRRTIVTVGREFVEVAETYEEVLEKIKKATK